MLHDNSGIFDSVFQFDANAASGTLLWIFLEGLQ